MGKISKVNLAHYNNIGIVSIGIEAVLTHSRQLSLSKLLLIQPFFSNQMLTQYLGRKTTKIKSIEKLIVEKTPLFSNFNRRYYDSLSLSFNSLQFLYDTEKITIESGVVYSNFDFVYNKKMGNRASKIFKASKNMSLILQDHPEKLYLNLRIEL